MTDKEDMNEDMNKPFFESIKYIIKNHGQKMMNIWLFLSFSAWCCWQTYKTYTEGNLNYIEISFLIQNIIMISLFLVRKEHKNINKKILDQTVAIVAFCSGAAFIGQPISGDPTIGMISGIIIFISNILGLMTLLNLGRSFGVLIALREVKTGGLYSIVRHPMYFTDILLRIGYVVSHFNLFTVIVFILSTLCYVYRAILEERFLSQDPEYAKYKEKIKYRFLPFIF